jgi:hypothetical protein
MPTLPAVDPDQHVRDKYWFLEPEELTWCERHDLRRRVIAYLGIPDAQWFSGDELAGLLDLHKLLRAWLEEDRECGQIEQPSLPPPRNGNA